MNNKHIKIRLWVKILLIIVFLICTTIVYSRFIEIKNFKVKEYAIIDKNIPSNFYGLKIVHISDIHYKVTTTKKDLKKIINNINSLKPDIVILSGDIVDSKINYSKRDISDLTDLLSSIEFNIGKYAIKGEEDLDNSNWEEIINNSEFIDLNDNYELIYSSGIEPILLLGISSNYKENHIKDTVQDIYSKIDSDYKYSILIMHEPDFIDDIDYSNFNLILAGHSHGGLVKIPFIGGIIKEAYSQKYYDDYYDLGNTQFYISSGIGTSKYKFRFLNPPSINFYRLRNK